MRRHSPVWRMNTPETVSPRSTPSGSDPRRIVENHATVRLLETVTARSVNETGSPRVNSWNSLSRSPAEAGYELPPGRRSVSSACGASAREIAPEVPVRNASGIASRPRRTSASAARRLSSGVACASIYRCGVGSIRQAAKPAANAKTKSQDRSFTGSRRGAGRRIGFFQFRQSSNDWSISHGTTGAPLNSGLTGIRAETIVQNPPFNVQCSSRV